MKITDSETISGMIMLYKIGFSLREIGKIYKIHQEAVRKNLKGHVKMRNGEALDKKLKKLKEKWIKEAEKL